MPRWTAALLLLLPALAAAQDRVDRYGDPLPPGARERLGSRALRDASRGNLRFLGDDRLITYSKSFRVWSLKTGQVLAQLPASEHEWKRILVSPDQRLLIGVRGYRPRGIEVWDLKTRKRKHLLQLPKDQSVDAFRLTGPNELLTAAHDELRWWDLKTGASKRLLVAEELMHGARFSPDGKWIVGHSTSGELRLFDMQRADVVRTLPAHRKQRGYASVYEHAISPNGKRVANVGGTHRGGKQLMLHALPDGQRLFAAPCKASAVRFAPDGKHLITLEDYKAVQVWDARSGKKTVRVPTGGFTSSLAVSPKGRIAVRLGGATGLLDWPLKPGQQLRRAKGHGSVSDLLITPDGGRVLSAGGPGVWEWSLADGRLLARHPTKARVAGLALSPDGKWLALRQRTAGLNGKPFLTIHARDGFKEVARLPLEGWLHTDLRFSPDGALLAVGDKDTRLIDTQTWKVKTRIKGMTWSLAFSPDGKQLAIGGGKTLRLWDVAKAKEARALPHPQVFGLAYSPDGKQLAYSSLRPREIKLLDLATGKPQHDLSRLFRINASPEPTYTPDGKLLVFGFSDKAARVTLVDPQTGKTAHTFQAPGEGYAIVTRFSPDGASLVTGMSSGTILVWSVRTQPKPRAQGLESPFSD